MFLYLKKMKIKELKNKKLKEESSYYYKKGFFLLK